MIVRVSTAFSNRWEEEWSTAQRMAGNDTYWDSRGRYHRALELFLEQFGPEIARALKHQLLETLLADAAQKNSPGTQNSLDTSQQV